MTTLHSRTLISHSPLWRGLPVIALAACFALWPAPKAFGADTQNTAVGIEALCSITTGSSNTAVGYEALNDDTTGSKNIAIGVYAGQYITTGSSNIYIGYPGVLTPQESYTIRIGDGTQTATYVYGISGVSVTGSAVLVSSSGQLGVAASSARFKEQVKPMDKASETILSLRPVTFRYKPELDPDGIAQFGLVAEEVEKVDPALVVHDADGKPYSVRYEAVNAMLLNEFLKEHGRVQEMEKSLAVVAAQLKEQAAQIQKVSTQIQVSGSTRKIALNNQ
jgi:hypothetical protein